MGLVSLIIYRFAGANLSKDGADDSYKKLVDTIIAHDKPRTEFVKACLKKLGLQVNEDAQPVPSLSRLHLSAHRPSDVSALVSSWQEIITLIDGEEYIKGDLDTFHLEKPASWTMTALKNTLATIIPDAISGADSNQPSVPAMIDYDKLVKKLFAHEDEIPSHKETPSFHHNAYFANLNHYRSTAEEKEGCFGKYLLYGEVVTSTQTMLEK